VDLVILNVVVKLKTLNAWTDDQTPDAQFFICHV
jgi:hypothetical protein